ncbi:MAG: hypothetical protein HYX68_21435 [Planctomycetes bacterium]|nr:hypothetical protein [Planctomycetota bacterium]
MRMLGCLLALLFASVACGQGNLLRNGDFQDDWLTHLPELKNHHWNYTTEVYNRRDYNPDGWRLRGKWEWRDADKPRGQRTLILKSPASVVQSVNWITIHNPAKLVGWPDAGGYPVEEAVRSKNPLALVRDLTFRVRLKGTNVPRDAVTLTAAWLGAGPLSNVPGAKAYAPEGTYADKLVVVKLPAATWLDAAKKEKDFAKQGAQLPMKVTCEIAYADKRAGSIDLLEASLDDPGPGSPNLLPTGGFEPDGQDYPKGWSKPQHYRYFPPGVYYIFNTWHNSNSDNRGAVGRDHLVPRSGQASLQMVVPTGDEVCVVSDPIMLSQPKTPRLIEVRAWVKTHQLCMMQIDAEDESGRRINGYNFIQKNPLSIGTNDWRQVRVVFRPTAPLKSMRLKLCARGMNGYTLSGTGHQPQQNAAGVIWWDDVEVFESESSPAELKARGVVIPAPWPTASRPHLARLDLGEQMLGRNEVTAEIANPGPAATFSLQMTWDDAKDGPVTNSGRVQVATGRRTAVRVPYSLLEPGRAYEEKKFILSLLDGKGKVIASSRHAVAAWTTPFDLELGSLYLRPKQKQFVRVNLGLSHPEMARLKELRLEIVRRGTGQVLKTWSLPATPTAMQRQRLKIPVGMLDDFRNLLVTDLDVSFLPLQPFTEPHRNWVLRASAISTDDKTSWRAVSSPFCRLAHDGPQPAIRSVRINVHGDFLINDKPWMPWGVTYGHNPVYDGPADSGKYYDLANLTPWGIYDRHGGNLAERSLWDLNCIRYVEGGKVLTREQLDKLWKQGLYASTVFLPHQRKQWPAATLEFWKTAPMVASVSRGPEEAFGYFTAMSKKEIDELKADVDHLRRVTGKPIMTGHGGYWNRLEFERAGFFDIFDPETEPWYPAPVHTDLKPLVEGKRKVIWLRPQMYESVPYERWRYHVFVELMRGARGWQLAHGPGDPSTFRGLHAELRYLQPAIYSREKTPAVSIEPGLEHLVRKIGAKTVIIAATTHGLHFGNWRKTADKSPYGLARVTADPHIFRDESDGYHATGGPASQSLCPHGIQYLANPKKWPAGSKLVTWVKLDAITPPKNLVAIVKADGRWTHAASWGKFDLPAVRTDNDKAFWFLRTFYRHARGFLGWGSKVPPYALDYLPAKTSDQGNLPGTGQWHKLEVPLDKIAAADKLIDGVGFLHDGGRVGWTRTVLVTPAGQETVIFGDQEDRPAPETLARTKITVQGLKKGTTIRVLFEDRTLTASDGYFTDDFSGVDLYQRYGGERSGYGNAPVAVHLYEIGQ